MNATLVRSYRSQNGNPTFVYSIKGNAEDLAKYKELQGDYYREDDQGNPLWFTTRCIGNTGKLLITSNNNIVPDMSEFDKAASIAAQYGGNFGNELAKAAAQKLTSNTNTSSISNDDISDQTTIHESLEE